MVVSKFLSNCDGWIPYTRGIGRHFFTRKLRNSQTAKVGWVRVMDHEQLCHRRVVTITVGRIGVGSISGVIGVGKVGVGVGVGVRRSWRFSCCSSRT